MSRDADFNRCESFELRELKKYNLYFKIFKEKYILFLYDQNNSHHISNFLKKISTFFICQNEHQLIFKYFKYTFVKR